MRYRALLTISAALLVGGMAAAAASIAGSGADPLISRSYTQGTYQGAVKTQAAAAAGEVMTAAADTISARLTQTENNYSDSAVESMLAEKIAAAMQGGAVGDAVTLAVGDTLKVELGAKLCLTAGAAQVTSGSLVNLTTGEALMLGGVLTRNQLYLADDGGASVQASAAGTAMRLSGGYSTSAGSASAGGSAHIVRYTKHAQALQTLGLFSGSNVGFELERVPTRAEGLVMLLRLLGKEEEASRYTGSHPFNDVPAWAGKYVAYAYDNHYTSGVSAKEFGSQNNLRANDYMTFLLRALGYNDSSGDFAWSTAVDSAVKTGILSQTDSQTIASQGAFYRDDVAYTSYNVLFLKRKGSEQRLCDYLIAQGVFTASQLDSAQAILA